MIRFTKLRFTSLMYELITSGTIKGAPTGYNPKLK